MAKVRQQRRLEALLERGSVMRMATGRMTWERLEKQAMVWEGTKAAAMAVRVVKVGPCSKIRQPRLLGGLRS